MPIFNYSIAIAMMCQIENTLTTYDPHALIIVYSIDDLESFHTASDSLAYLNSQNCSDKRAKILVANKIDLQRSRVVSALGTVQCQCFLQVGIQSREVSLFVPPIFQYIILTLIL